MSNGNNNDKTKASPTSYNVKPTVLASAPVVAGVVNVVHSSVCNNVPAQLTTNAQGQLVVKSTVAGVTKATILVDGQSLPCPFCKQTMSPLEFNMQRMRGGG